MIYLASFTRQVLREMRSKKMRSALAMFCIAWGTLTVALLLAVGSGFNAASRKNIFNVTENLFSVVSGQTSMAYRGRPAGRGIRIRVHDIVDLPQIIPQIQEVTPFFIKNNTNVAFKNKQLQKTLYSVGPNFIRMRKIKMEYPGRFFNQIDLNQASRVVVLGHKLKEELFADTNALDKRVIINNVSFTVIGVIQQFTKNVYNWYDNALLIPYTTYMAINGDEDVYVVILMPAPNADAAITEQNIRSYFAYKYGFNRNDKTAIQIFSTAQTFQFFKWFFLAIQLFLGMCGAFTLGVGSIGIANLMFLSVTERTKEIGLRKALGACNWQVLLQILIESLVIVACGGVAGFGVAYLIILILQYLPLPEWLGTPVMSWFSITMIVGILAFFGIAAGYFPARRAANLDPVDALKKQ